MPLRRRLAAALVAALAAMGAMPAAAQAPERNAVLLSYGPDLGRSGGRSSWREAQVTAEIRSGRAFLGPLRPVYSLSVSRQGAVLGGVGLLASLPLGAAELTPSFSVALWQDGHGGFDARALIQFRTGIDLLVPVTQNASVGLGIFHVSNAGLTRRSADLDVVRLAVQWRY